MSLILETLGNIVLPGLGSILSMAHDKGMKRANSVASGHGADIGSSGGIGDVANLVSAGMNLGGSPQAGVKDLGTVPVGGNTAAPVFSETPQTGSLAQGNFSFKNFLGNTFGGSKLGSKVNPAVSAIAADPQLHSVFQRHGVDPNTLR